MNRRSRRSKRKHKKSRRRRRKGAATGGGKQHAKTFVITIKFSQITFNCVRECMRVCVCALPKWKMGHL